MSFYIKDTFDNLLHTDFFIILSIFIPIIHHEKKSSYTRFEPQLGEELSWHQTMSILQLIYRGQI